MERENQDYIQDLKTEFETERKEKEILFLKKLNETESIKAKAIQSNQRFIIAISLLALILMIVFAIFFSIKKRKEKEIHIIEKKLLEVDIQNKELISKELKNELVNKTRQLTTHALNMMQKNQMLTDFKLKLKMTLKLVDGDLNTAFKTLIRDINQSQKTEKD